MLISLTVIALAVVYLLFWPKELRLFCPIHALTGFWCPGCGSTRAADALLRGDLDRALKNNALFLASPLFAIVGVYLERKNSKIWLVYLLALLVLVTLFTIVRNLPGSSLAPL